MSVPRTESVNYKWNPRTKSGYVLRFDPNRADRGLPNCYHVEDWDNRTIVNDWPCNSLDDVLNVLGKLFDIDSGKEAASLKSRFTLGSAA